MIKPIDPAEGGPGAGRGGARESLGRPRAEWSLGGVEIVSILREGRWFAQPYSLYFRRLEAPRDELEDDLGMG
jgi:hypothetical protein